jgi:hypothetical protein
MTFSVNLRELAQQGVPTAQISSGFAVQRGELVTASMAGDIYKWYVTRWGAVGRSIPQHTRISGPFLSQNEALSEKARIESGKPPTKPLATADPTTNILIGKVLAQQQKPETELVAAPSGTVVATVQPAPAAPKPKTGTAVALGAAALAAYFFLK